MSTMAERLAEESWRHKMARPADEPVTWCTCLGWSVTRGDLSSDERAHNEHLAQALLPVIEREITAARGEALREAADEIERVERIGQTSASETDTAELEWFHEHPLRNVDGYQRHRPVVADWLRVRAALTPDPDREAKEGGRDE